MKIRLASTRDCEDIQRIYSSAFPISESDRVAKLAMDLMHEERVPRIISLIAEQGGVAVGHIAFSPVEVVNNNNILGYILAPLAVLPDYQRCGIASKLIENGIRQLTVMGTNVVFVYGDPEFYARFGFSDEAVGDFVAPYKLLYPFGWQAIVLNEYAIENGPAPISCVSSLCYPELW